MSSDWWTQSTSTSTSQQYNTPQRSHSTPIHGGGGNSTANHPWGKRSAIHAGDDLDEEDAKMAEGIRFLPSFANSPAGKLALGTSPGSTSSPPAGRKSPTTRFSSSVIPAGSSPRHTRSRTTTSLLPTLQGDKDMDDDLPPTTSLRDSVGGGGGRSSGAGGAGGDTARLPTPPTLLPSSTTTKLLIFGPPMTTLSTLQTYLSQSGPIIDYKPGPEGTNWYIVSFGNPQSAGWCLRRHGEVVGGRWILGVRVWEEGFGTAGGGEMITNSNNTESELERRAPANLNQNQIQHQTQTQNQGPGTPIPIKTAVIKPKPTPSALSTTNRGEEYSWDDDSGRGGGGKWGGVAEWLFGR